ncbi:GH25 family lysozyme [Streptomyces kunmingensis]|uniref:GH25 family lysozyme n=1 Tax=Streptomyces kunmingensis TaxID=68225 RepID=A0ABU6C3D8_9ACTN|nr:GH25 family lysozyme [Streptomyces kunmingensis]MEB3958712.1 GH25 family lysozyme [Streptomyces kunmingensis]
MLHGLHLNAYQPPSYPTDDHAFVFLQATEGRTHTNPRLEALTRTARRAHLVVGFCHFLLPGRPRAQARHFLTHIPDRDGDVLIVDWETTADGSRATSQDKDRFIRRLKKLRPRRRIVLYATYDTWLQTNSGAYDADGLWIADHTTPGEPRIQSDWLFHQYTGHPHGQNVARFPDTNALHHWANTPGPLTVPPTTPKVL